jgi:hypothetical protein
MMIETLQSAVALSLDIPLIIKELFELIGTKLPFSGEIIFIPPLALGIVELRFEPVKF